MFNPLVIGGLGALATAGAYASYRFQKRDSDTYQTKVMFDEKMSKDPLMLQNVGTMQASATKAWNTFEIVAVGSIALTALAFALRK